MKPSLYIALACFGMAGFMVSGQSAGSNDYEVLLKDMLGTVEDIAKILKTVKDRDSATAAQPELKKAADKMLELRKKAADVKQPSKPERDRLEKEYAPKFEVAVKKCRELTINVKGIPGGDKAAAELDVLADKDDKQKGNDKKTGK